MKTVVFACRSNSCRSQMAEGWAREWIRQEALKQDLPEERRMRLEKLVIASVALDASSVFSDLKANDMNFQQDEECCCDPCSTPKQRKTVKSKAVDAMALDGVDISTFVPKTMEEVLPKLQSFGESCLVTTEAKPIDNLVILCSCGDDVKHLLVNKSKHVSEWNVDAPTACAKAGEGESAYRRVSMEIKNQVHLLMENLVKQESMFSGTKQRVCLRETQTCS